MSRIGHGVVAFGMLVSAFGVAHAKVLTQLDHEQMCATNQTFTNTEIDNQFAPFLPGQVSTFFGKEMGKPIGLTIEVQGPGGTQLVAGVPTRIFIETEWVDVNADGLIGSQADEPLIERSFNYVAQVESTGPNQGTVCYFGEDVTIYDDEGDPLPDPEGSKGSWLAGQGANKPGIFMPGQPAKDQTFQTEDAPNVAEDNATIVGVARSIKVPFGPVGPVLKVRDCNPLDGECDTKQYASGVGLAVDGSLKLTGFEQN